MRWTTYLPGHFELARGTPADYFALERFHYRAGRPATWAGVWVVRHVDGGARRVVAVGVLSYPCVAGAARDRALGLERIGARERLRFVNANVRTISRVVVHPQFRAMGLASRLVRTMCARAGVRWVEALAAMGRVHPFFARGGMREVGVTPKGVVYYLFDREGER
ncbi:MAG TPA: hypothetical protein VEA69_21475 [Tepidisphaeraceae bacterium]|nr:hypothetical protein [Tepidisphaeraceae bacterium]